MEAIALGKELYLKPYRKGLVKIPYFRGVYMRNELPKSGPLKYDSAIVNLDDKDGPGTYWVAYRTINNQVVYFDSFGNLQPPLDLIEYLGLVAL